MRRIITPAVTRGDGRSGVAEPGTAAGENPSGVAASVNGSSRLARTKHPGSRAFGERLASAIGQYGPLCVGIDPHQQVLREWGLTGIDGLRVFAETMREALLGRVAVVKPQSAFFEAFGASGVSILEDLIRDFRQSETLVLLDVKRGDIGSTMDAYAQTHFGSQAPSRCDAITLNPFLGTGSLLPAVERALDDSAGVFVLALTSNPQGAQVQHAQTLNAAGTPQFSVAQAIIDQVGEWNRQQDIASNALGSVGLVIGATIGNALWDLNLMPALCESQAPILAPGYGAQGGTVAGISAAFGPASRQVVAATSRGITNAGPRLADLRSTIEAARKDVAMLHTNG